MSYTSNENQSLCTLMDEWIQMKCLFLLTLRYSKSSAKREPKKQTREILIISFAKFFSFFFYSNEMFLVIFISFCVWINKTGSSYFGVWLCKSVEKLIAIRKLKIAFLFYTTTIDIINTICCVECNFHPMWMFNEFTSAVGNKTIDEFACESLNWYGTKEAE